MKRKLYLIVFTLHLLFVWIASTLPVISEESSRSKIDSSLYFGFIGGITRIQNETALPVMPECSDCGRFTNGTDYGFLAGIDGSYKIIDNFLFASSRIFFTRRPITLSTLTSNFEVYDEIKQEYVPLNREFTYEGALDYLVIDIGIKVKPLPQIPVFLRFSVDAGNALFGSNYEIYDHIETPEWATFPDNSRRRLHSSGKVDKASTSTGASIALQAEFPMDLGFVLTPELSYRYGLNSVVAGNDWHTEILSLSLGISWCIDGILKTQHEPEPEPELFDTIVAEPEIYVDEIEGDIIEYQPDNIIIDFQSKPFKLRETVVTQTFPLLQYIFFDSASAELRSIYDPGDLKENTFSEDMLPMETLSIYYLLLDIIGSRMKKLPSTRINITGVTDGEELPDTIRRLELAEKRAMTIVNFISKRWGINPDRFVIKAKDVPDMPTSKVYAEGYEENRRVEFSTNDHVLLEPVVHLKFLEYTSKEKRLDFNINIRKPKDVKFWNLFIMNRHKKVLGYFSGKEELESKVLKVVPKQHLINKIGGQVSGNDTLLAQLQVVLDDGRTEESLIELPVVKSLDQFEIGRLNLIVFDFDKAEISRSNKEMLIDFINTAIHDNSTTNIIGSTDRLGEPEYNRTLSINRAVSVRNYINKLKPSVKINEVKGLGAKYLQYDNNIPEGRYYCRTVLIEVKTPFE
ncbi:OmpA family protein [Bacteroidota bacterium]